MKKSIGAILSLSWQSVAYGIGTLGSQLVTFLMLPFLTRYLSKEEYGVISIILAVYAFFNMLTNAGLPQATFRFYNQYQEEKNQQIVIGTSQFLFFIYSAIPATVFLLFPQTLSRLFTGSTQYVFTIQIVAIYLIIESMNTFGTIVLRIEVRPLVSSLHTIFQICCKAGFALIFVIVYKMGVDGYWLGNLFGSLIGFIVMLWLIRNKLTLKISQKMIWGLVNYGAPLIPASLSMTILRLADRYIIGAIAGLEQVAIYDVGYKVGTILLFIITPFRTAWIPFAFSIAHTPEARRIYRDVLTYLVAGCLFLALIVITFQRELVTIIAPEAYTNSVFIIPWVVVSQVFLAAYHVLSVGAMIANKTRSLAWIALFAGGMNLLLNFFLIPKIGILGAAIATLIGYTLLSMLTYFVSKHSFHMAADRIRLGKLIFVSGLLLLNIVIINKFVNNLLIQISLKTIGLFLFPYLLFLFRFFNIRQIKETIDIAKSIYYEKSVNNM